MRLSVIMLAGVIRYGMAKILYVNKSDSQKGNLTIIQHSKDSHINKNVNLLR